MVFLFLFVGYWNVFTYLREKSKLIEEVELHMQLAFTEVKDSELVYFIKAQLDKTADIGDVPDSISILLDQIAKLPPLLEDIKVKVDADSIADGLAPDTMIFLDININANSTEIRGIERPESEVAVISRTGINNFVISEKKENDTTAFNFNLKRQLPTAFEIDELVKKADSVKSQKWTVSGDTSNLRARGIYKFSIDTASLSDGIFNIPLSQSSNSVEKTYALLKSKLIQQGLPHTFSVADDSEQESSGLKIEYTSKGLSPTQWGIDLQDYQLYLIKKILPTLLFSLLLLGMISIAFWTLIRNWRKQNQLVVVKNEFINNMTHELKTPIATIGVALEAVANFDPNTEKDKAEEYIEISRNETRRLSDLVDKVLNIAAFDSNKSVLSTEAVDLHQAVEDIINSMKIRIQNSNAQIELVNKAQSTIVIGDRLHLTNAMHNIIDNALKYSDGETQLNITFTDNATHLTIAFADRGKGIPKAYLPKIFDRFFRVPTADLHDVKGHGLGLNYVQNTVHAHGGTISVESIEHQGSTFTIKLPKSTDRV